MSTVLETHRIDTHASHPCATTELADTPRAIRPGLIVLAGVAGTAFLTLAPSYVGALVDTGALIVAQAGQVASSHMLGLTVGPLLALIGLRALRTRMWMGCGIVGAAAGHAACAYLRSFWPLLGAQFVAGTGAGLIFASASVLAAAAAKPERVYSQMFMAMMVFGAAGFIAIPLLLEHLGLALSFGLAAATALALLPFLGQVPRHVEQAAAGGRSFHWTVPTLLVMFALFLHYVANSAVWAYLDRIGVAANLDAKVVGVVLAISMLASVVGGMLVDRATRFFSFYHCLMAGVVAISAATALMFAPRSVVDYGFAVFLYLAAMTFTIPIFQGLMATIDTSKRCVLYGNATLMFGQGIGPAIGSKLDVGHSFSPLLTTSLGLFASALVLVMIAARMDTSEAQS